MCRFGRFAHSVCVCVCVPVKFTKKLALIFNVRVSPSRERRVISLLYIFKEHFTLPEPAMTANNSFKVSLMYTKVTLLLTLLCFTKMSRNISLHILHSLARQLDQ